MRLVALVGAVTLALGVGAGSASAAAQVQTYAFHGLVADAVWDTSTSTASTSTEITVARNQQGRALFLYRFTATFDSGGTYTGSRFTTADVGRGFSLSLGGSLSGARVSGQDLAATTCSYDAAGVLVGCTATTVDVEATWTGEGPVSRSTSTAHFHGDDFTSVYHDRGSIRQATATGMVDGLQLPAASLVDAHIGKDTNGSVEICVGDGC